MTKKMLAALKESIAHYECMYSGKEPMGAAQSDCALCAACGYDHDEDTDPNCTICPVYRRTKRRDRKGTPYWEFFNWVYRNKLRAKGPCKREIAFLKSLLPKGNQA